MLKQNYTLVLITTILAVILVAAPFNFDSVGLTSTAVSSPLSSLHLRNETSVGVSRDDFNAETPTIAFSDDEGIDAVTAFHLNENFALISDIYDGIKAKDNRWSELIINREFVRVTYEQDLIDGRVIDFYARSSGKAYVEIYQAGTMHLVGKSELIDKPGWHYVAVKGLIYPTAIFDFKIISASKNSQEKVSVEFDYIHDRLISTDTVEGMAVYMELNKGVTYWRRLNASSNFTAPDLTVDGGSDIEWIVIHAAPTRDEMIMGTEDSLVDVRFQIFNDTFGNGNWSTLLTASLNAAPSTGRRGFDVAYEDLSGDALLLYQNDSSAATHPFIQFRTWNGTDFSDQRNITMRDTTGYEMMARTAFIMLFPKPKTDDIMSLIVNNTDRIYAVPWNGTDFNLNHSLVITNASRSDTNPHFNFAWESQSDEGLAAYSDATSRYVRPYSPITGWGDQIAIDNNGAILALEMCSDPESDYIGIISQDSGNDQNVSMWNGSQFLSDGPAIDGSAEAPGAGVANFACAWYNSTTALFAYTKSNALNLSYFTFTKPDIWSVTSLLSAPQTVDFARDDINGIQFNKHPVTGDIMIFASDFLSNLTAIRWLGNGSFLTIGDFPSSIILETTSRKAYFFEWFRFDPIPNVTTLVPALDSNFTPGTTIEISANVTDNLLLRNESFLVNLTFPNGSIEQLTIRNSTGNPSKFNTSFTLSTGLEGLYIVRILANDSRGGRNWTQITNFTATDNIPPAVTITNPANGSFLSSGAQAFNATIRESHINSMTVIFQFSNTTGNDFNATPTNASGNWNTNLDLARLTEGLQGMMVFANDSLNNINNTESINFTVDRTAPNVTLNFANNPVDNSNFSIRTNNRTFNASIFDALTQVDTVYFWVDNGTGKDFNITGTNRSGEWSVGYNVSTLAEEKQGVRIVANDSANNVNSSYFINFTVDFTPPSVNITAPTAGATLTGTLSFNATVNDSLLEVQAVIFQFSNGTTPFNRTASNSSGTWNVSVDTTTIADGALTVTVFANDTVGNMNSSQTLSLTVDNIADAAPAATSGGGGGGGGTSAGVTSAKISASAENSWDMLLENSIASVKIADEKIAITDITFKVEKAIADAKIIIESLKFNPQPVHAATKVYQYVEVTRKKIENTDVSKVIITFQVPREWLFDNNVAEQEVVLYRYSGGWASLPTEKTSQSAKYVLYQAATPGFSTFAIGVKKLPVLCKTDFDCGKDEIVKRYCIGNDIYQEYTRHICIDAGTSLARCKPLQEAELIEHCEFGCAAETCTVPEILCDAEHISGCVTEEACVKSDLYWYDAVCHAQPLSVPFYAGYYTKYAWLGKFALLAFLSLLFIVSCAWAILLAQREYKRRKIRQLKAYKPWEERKIHTNILLIRKSLERLREQKRLQQLKGLETTMIEESIRRGEKQLTNYIKSKK